MTIPEQMPTDVPMDAQAIMQGIKKTLYDYHEAVTRVFTASDRRHQEEIKKKLKA